MNRHDHDCDHQSVYLRDGLHENAMMLLDFPMDQRKTKARSGEEMKLQWCLTVSGQISFTATFSSKIILWAGEDLNLRRLTPTGLQPVPFGHSGTDPEVRILALEFEVHTY